MKSGDFDLVDRNARAPTQSGVKPPHSKTPSLPRHALLECGGPATAFPHHQQHSHHLRKPHPVHRRRRHDISPSKKTCRRRDSNPHGVFTPSDFKSDVSAIPPRRRRLTDCKQKETKSTKASGRRRKQSPSGRELAGEESSSTVGRLKYLGPCLERATDDSPPRSRPGLFFEFQEPGGKI